MSVEVAQLVGVEHAVECDGAAVRVEFDQCTPSSRWSRTSSRAGLPSTSETRILTSSPLFYRVRDDQKKLKSHSTRTLPTIAVSQVNTSKNSSSG